MIPIFHSNSKKKREYFFIREKTDDKELGYQNGSGHGSGDSPGIGDIDGTGYGSRNNLKNSLPFGSGDGEAVGHGSIFFSGNDTGHFKVRKNFYLIR